MNSRHSLDYAHLIFWRFAHKDGGIWKIVLSVVRSRHQRQPLISFQTHHYHSGDEDDVMDNNPNPKNYRMKKEITEINRS